MIYGYVRVSSTDQKIDRQTRAMKEFAKKENIEFDDFYVDKESGKDFERKNYQIMKKRLTSNDLVVIKSIDRLGRNYDKIIEEWSNITKTIGCDIVVIDMPLLDTRQKKDNLTGKFISDLVLQILSYVAETERRNIKERQAEGIRIAKEKGIHFGKTSTYDNEFKNKCQIDYENGMRFVDIANNRGCSVPILKAWSRNNGWDRVKHRANYRGNGVVRYE